MFWIKVIKNLKFLYVFQSMQGIYCDWISIIYVYAVLTKFFYVCHMAFLSGETRFLENEKQWWVFGSGSVSNLPLPGVMVSPHVNTDLIYQENFWEVISTLKKEGDWGDWFWKTPFAWYALRIKNFR